MNIQLSINTEHKTCASPGVGTTSFRGPLNSGKKIGAAVLLTSVLSLVACGGGGGDAPPPLEDCVLNTSTIGDCKL